MNDIRHMLGDGTLDKRRCFRIQRAAGQDIAT